MKKWIMSSLAILLGVLSISIPLAGVRTAEAGTTEDSGKKLKIVTTIFPEYDWTRAVLGDREADVDLTMLLDNGTDLHSFQPAVKDIMKVSSCDLLIYVGGESDQWIEDALESAHQDVSVTAEFNIDRITIIQGFSEILQNIPDYFVLVEPDAVFKMKIQAAVVHVDGSDHGLAVIACKYFCMHKARCIFITSTPRFAANFKAVIISLSSIR